MVYSAAELLLPAALASATILAAFLAMFTRSETRLVVSCALRAVRWHRGRRRGLGRSAIGVIGVAVADKTLGGDVGAQLLVLAMLAARGARDGRGRRGRRLPLPEHTRNARLVLTCVEYNGMGECMWNTSSWHTLNGDFMWQKGSQLTYAHNSYQGIGQ